jgi:hypothetical protein
MRDDREFPFVRGSDDGIERLAVEDRPRNGVEDDLDDGCPEGMLLRHRRFGGARQRRPAAPLVCVDLARAALGRPGPPHGVAARRREEGTREVDPRQAIA